MENTAWCGVITGDIVGSQQLSDSEYRTVLTQLEQSLMSLCDRYAGNFDIFRGDAFQIQLTHPEHSMKVAVALWLSLKAGDVSTDIRQCVGLGAATNRSSSPNRSNGEAYVLSGNGLDSMKSERLSVRSASADFDERFGLLTRFLDVQLSGLTGVQSRVLSCFLLSDDKSHEALAAALNKSRSNVTRILLAANYHLVTDYLAYFCHHVVRESQR